MPKNATICLCMIVRNESHIIERALNSAKPMIDYWVICDTGSTDQTQAITLQAMAGKAGELHQHEWVNFGHNREKAIRLAQGKADYILIMDADMVANIHAPFKHLLEADSYLIKYEGNLDYAQTMLVANRHTWSYIGVTHEYIYTKTARTEENLPELTLTHVGDGGMRSDKFERDIKLLTASLKENPDNIRDTFYLAQSYRDLDQYAEALYWYRKRVSLGGWDEECWHAMFQEARMMELSGVEWGKVFDAYMKAYTFRPARLEPLYHIIRHYRENEEYTLGYNFSAFVAKGIVYPDKDTLFIEKPVYQYLLLLEYGTCAHGKGRISEAVHAFNEVLNNSRLPEWVFDAAQRGREISLPDLYQASPKQEKNKNRIVVLTPFHNVGKFLKTCVESLTTQDYENFEVLFINDACTDNPAQYLPSNDDRYRHFTHKRRRGIAANLHHYIRKHCQPDDIVVCVDGDDYLACPDALNQINDYYNTYDCWVMYGQFRYVDGISGWSQPFSSPREFNNLRQSFFTSHIRTFRAGLFHQITDQDPDYNCLKDEQGAWLESAVDVALMAPLCEMAGFNRVCFNSSVLYVYNNENPSNIHQTNRALQKKNFSIVANKRPFARIDDYLQTVTNLETIAR